MSATPVPVPGKPMSLDKVIEAYPVLRQSLLANYDDCSLYSFFSMRDTQAWSTHPQARGTIFHRAAAECLREMQTMDSEQIPQSMALAILEDVLKQRDVPPIDRVRLPMREIPVLRMAIAKFAKDNTFTIRNIIAIEKRLEATLEYDDDEGTIRQRRLSGMPDVMVLDPSRPEDGVIVVDFKDTWALPPERPQERKRDTETQEQFEEKKALEALSWHGFFQQRFYAWLILKNFPKIKWVTLREFYARRSKSRPATVGRDKLPQIEEQIANLVRDFDRSIAAGRPKRFRFPEVASWQPSPGKQCFWCSGRTHCPIPKHVKDGYAIQGEKEARETVGQIEVLEAQLKLHKEAIRPYVEEHGPVASKAAKHSRAYGLRTNSSGRPELRFFVPEGADAAPRRRPSDKKLEAALKEATDEAKAERVDS